jgi:putative ATP-dependent endonuclease of OLD family
MYLHELKLWNFRKYGSDKFDLSIPHLTVPFQKGLNVLIGENDSGKTAILDAIKLVLKTHAYEWIKVESTDFCNNADKLRIELEFRGLEPNEAKNFIEWLGWEGETENAIPILRLIYQVEKNDDRIFPTDVKAGMDDIGYPLNAEAREYLKTTYLKALRDADNDLTAKKNSRLSQILQEHELFKKKNRNEKHFFEEKFEILNREMETWFTDKSKIGDSEKSNHSEIKEKIDSFLTLFLDENKKSNFSLGGAEIKNILEKISLGINNASNLGLGTMNRLYMAAELLHLKKDWSGLKLCLIEELEAHLHPQAQMKVIEALQQEKKVQLILTTHSPNLASKVKLHELILCKDNDVFPLGEEPNDQNKRLNIDKYTKLSKDNYKYLERFLDVTKSNLFFANGVILVEGWSEEILIPTLAKRLGFDLTKKVVSIINVGSTAYLHFARIFLRKDQKQLKVPVSVISDIDLPEFEREPEIGVDNKVKKNGKRTIYIYNKIANSDAERKVKKDVKENEFLNDKYVKHFVSDLWTFEYCLLKSEILSKKYKEILKEIHSETFTDDNWEQNLSKILLSKSIKKTEIAYRLSFELETIDFSNLKDIDTLNYIIKAIKHSCNGNND